MHFLLLLTYWLIIIMSVLTYSDIDLRITDVSVNSDLDYRIMTV